MQNRLETNAAQTCMAMDNLNALSQHNISEDRKEGEYCWEGTFAIDYQERNVVDFEPIREVVNSSPTFVGMGDHNHFVSPVDQFG